MGVPLSQTYGKEEAPTKRSGGEWDTGSPRSEVVPGSLRIELTRVTPLWPRKAYIQWVLRNPEFASGYLFDIYRSGSAEGPWETVVKGLTDTFYYLDEGYGAAHDRTTPDLMSLVRVMVYRVDVRRVTDILARADKAVEISPDRRRRGIQRKLARDARVSLKKGSGTLMAVFKRRWWGEPCACRALTGQSTKAHCATCHGTGIVTGYWNPVYSYGQRTATPSNAQIGVQGQIDINRLRVLMPDVPQVAPLDVLVFVQDNRRFMVENLVNTEIHTMVVHQEIDVTELARTATEYNLQADPWRDPKWF